MLRTAAVTAFHKCSSSKTLTWDKNPAGSKLEAATLKDGKGTAVIHKF